MSAGTGLLLSVPSALTVPNLASMRQSEVISAHTRWRSPEPASVNTAWSASFFSPTSAMTS